MNKKENLFTTTLRLNLNNAQDMEAWNNLMSTDRNQPEYSSYSRTIVTAINDHFARQDRMEEQQEWETALLKKIEATIRETFARRVLPVCDHKSLSAKDKESAIC